MKGRLAVEVDLVPLVVPDEPACRPIPVPNDFRVGAPRGPLPFALGFAHDPVLPAHLARKTQELG